MQDQAVDDGSQVLPPEGRSDGRPAHRIEHDRRRALVRDAHDVGATADSFNVRVREFEGESAISTASSSTSPGLGVDARRSRCRCVRDVAPGVDDRRADRRRADVDGEGPHHGAPAESEDAGIQDVVRGRAAPSDRARSAKALPERVGHESGAVTTDAVVVTERAAAAQYLGRVTHVPRAAVEARRIVVGPAAKVK